MIVPLALKTSKDFEGEIHNNEIRKLENYELISTAKNDVASCSMSRGEK